MHRNRRFPSLLVLLAATLAPDAASADASDGARLARQWCANCHVVDGAQPSGAIQQGPPSFRIIAGHLDPGGIRSFLSQPHGAMPDLALTRAEIDSLVAYIGSLK